jgi:2,4-dienoyl-CoA reductase-like NADH-dependent reductase (Old Yellow Enzyme family)
MQTSLGSENTSSNHVLQNSLELPCGAILKNRLTKSPMSDSLGNGEGDPTEAQIRLYERWAEGGAALSIIGEVQGNSRYPEKPGNLVFGPKSNQQALRSLASRAVIEGAHLWPQLGHAGALSHLPISQPKGPSVLNLDGLQCASMTINEVQELPSIYAKTALLAKSTGFSGVLIHAGHGFLLNQFLSPLFNHRKDGYGGSIEARCRIVLDVISAVRQAVDSTFPVGIRINSTDKLEGGLTEVDALEVIRLLDQTSVDLIDISGVTYFPGAKASSEGNSDGGPYFLDFARRAKEETQIPLMLTGGFKRREEAIEAISSGAVDMVGLARAMVINPQLPKNWLNNESGDLEFPRFESPPKGGMTAWYTMRIIALSEDREDEFNLDLDSAIRIYEKRDEQRCIKWLRKFSQK